MTENERAARTLKHVLQKPGNGSCADCGADNPEWGSCSLGVFICLACSGVHRSIPDLGKVKSLRLSRWEDSEVQFMSERGNDAMNAVYEAALPVYYYKPTHRDCHVADGSGANPVEEEFMPERQRAFYEERKRGRDNGQFLNRRFVLSLRDCTLKYFTKLDAKEPKAVLKVDTINALASTPAWKSSDWSCVCVSVSLLHQEIVEWFNCIRAAQLHYLKVAFPGATDAELKPKLTRSFLKEGYMEKTGPRQTEGFKKRWFTLDHRRLMYFKDPLDAFAKGEVFLGHRDHGYRITIGLPAGTHYNGSWQYGITIETPDRSFLFTCETDTEQKDWMRHFNAVINTPMSPQEYTVEAYFKHKH
ncbi:arf-GAP with dual PH domain-containing protein 1-like [Cyprinus carpio]|uniref:Arf-GAP with dual PH domain-containing protein 1-like n=1 Tax=Cyprinus carpio TaxID=7962 RepID=A0A9R0A0S3_CYPCA|nr:arf-GAP with dual PH domain-containing protein 1-like [Cyprinus carpio]